MPALHENLSKTDEALPETSKESFGTVLTELAEWVPEIAARPELQAAGGKLIDQFELQPSLFHDKGRALVFASIASRYAEQELDGVDHTEESRFIEGSLALLAHQYSDKLAPIGQQLKREAGEYSDGTLRPVYDKYTDTHLSALLEERIRSGGLLDEVKGRLGITDENEDHFIVRAMTFGGSMQTYGLEAPTDELYDDVRVWRQELERRREDFARETHAPIAEAWVIPLDGEQNLCISSALAEKLLNPELTKSAGYYDERSAASDRAMLEHEYTHTQGGQNIDGGVMIGINIEELRAEHFSGNKLGYADIKGFFRDYGIITGHDMSTELASHVKGGTQEEVYSAIANRVGLRELLSVVLVAPSKYVEDQSNSLARSLQDHLGGLDGVLQTLLVDQLRAGHGKEIETRVEQSAQRLIEIVESSDAVLTLDDFAEYRRNSLDLHVVTDLIHEKAQDLRKKESVDA